MKKKRILALFLAAVSCLSLAVSASAAGTTTRKATDFKDYDRTAWYAEAVSAAVDTRLPQIRSRKCRNRSRYRRCTCDRQPFPRRRARVGDLCGFPDTAERVPAERHKTGRCASVRERYEIGKHGRRSPAGGFRRREKPQAAKQEKAKVSCAHLGRHICPQCGQFGTFGQGLLRGQKQPCWGRKRR